MRVGIAELGNPVPLTAKWPFAGSSVEGLVSGSRKHSHTEGLQPPRQARFVEGTAVGHLCPGLG